VPVTSLSSNQAQYTVFTPLYEGPLDLLLQLIERAELDITRLSLAQVTDQFLAHLRDLEFHEATEVSSFIIIAARLIQIKSEALLPRPPARDAGEEDPGELLAQQLRLYRLFKQAAGRLGSIEGQGLRSYLRLAPAPKMEGRLDLSEITLDDLIFAAYDIFEKQKEPQHRLGTIVAPPKVTIREKIGQILMSARSKGSFKFSLLIHRVSNRLEIVVTFLAMLELVKRHIIHADQDQLFGDISFELSPLTNGTELDQDFDLEFGE
jgi:segregation and condensation protein A